MPRSGRFLELMVRELQKTIKGDRIEIKSPHIFYDDHGHQAGEIDVTVRGALGISRFFLGFECRDRPSDGPQGPDWIRALAGKRQVFDLDKIVGVSTTGFTQQAIHEAINELNIDLIDASQPSSLVVGKYVKRVSFSFDRPTIKAITARPNTDPPTIGVESFSAQGASAVVKTAFGDLSLQQFIETTARDVMRRLSDADSLVPKEFRFEIPIPTGQLNLADGSQVPIVGGSVELLGEMERCSGQTFLTPLRRASDGEVVGLHGLAGLHFPNESLKIVVVQTPEAGDWSNMTMRVTFFDSAGKEIQLLAGTRISLTRIPLPDTPSSPNSSG